MATNAPTGPPPSAPNPAYQAVLAALAGVFLGLTLLKFGNPVVLERLVPVPENAMEIFFQAWPLTWGYVAVALVVLAAIPLIKWGAFSRHWPLLLPLPWLAWQFFAATRTINNELTASTLRHFVACGVLYCVGYLALSRLRSTRIIWNLALISFLYVLWQGFGQHYGGLEQTRRYIYENTDWRQLPPEYLQKLGSNRIFSTLVYPNAFAGVILMWLPFLSWHAWNLATRWGHRGQVLALGLVLYGGGACLFWSGSKAGWLIAMLTLCLLVFHLKFNRRLRIWLIVIGGTLGLAAFFLKYSDYFSRGATSVSARTDYWEAALVNCQKYPIFGSGPGTFSKVYQLTKRPGSEMARLTHNDYLEQASDSGIPGFIGYFLFITGSIWCLYRYSSQNVFSDQFFLWLGLAAWALQSAVEFNLYIPALAWPVFLLLGWLWGSLPVTPLFGRHHPEQKLTSQP